MPSVNPLVEDQPVGRAMDKLVTGLVQGANLVGILVRNADRKDPCSLGIRDHGVEGPEPMPRGYLASVEAAGTESTPRRPRGSTMVTA
jgi:hypothetical protein